MMKHKSKLGYLAVLALVAIVGMARHVNAQALTFDSLTNVDIGGNTYTIDSGGGATSVIVGSSTITIEVPAASTVVFASRDRFALDNDGSLTTTCTDVNSYITITGAATVVVTPDTSDVCSSGGGGGGGGGTTKTPTPTPTPVPTPTPGATPTAPVTIPSLPASPTVDDISDVLSAASSQLAYILANPDDPSRPALIASLSSTLSDLLAALSAVAGGAGEAGDSVPPGGSYTTPLSNGSAGDDVTALQNFLSSQGPSVYPEGLVTGYFGSLTEQAVQRFQVAQGIAGPGDPGYGFVGPATRARINAILGL